MLKTGSCAEAGPRADADRHERRHWISAAFVRRGLITDGFFARVRHPNYLGEMILYASFASLAGHWLPWVVLAWVWTGVFLPNMLRKEASMSRYPEWAACKARTGFLLPSLRPAPAPAPAASHRAGAASSPSA